MLRRFPFWSSVLLGLFVATTVSAQEPFRYPEGKHGTGELKYINEVPVLSVSGTPAEMGEAAGVLVLKPAHKLFGLSEEFARRHGLTKLLPLMLNAGGFFSSRFPPHHLKEIDALAKASGQPRGLLIGLNIFHDLMGRGGCSALMVEGSRSSTGQPLFGRNLDWPPFFNLHEYTIVTVYRPNGKHAFALIGYPGMIGCATGMNDAGLCLATLEVTASKDKAPRYDPRGTPYMLALRQVLEECSTVEEAEKMLRSMRRATMHNLAICDKKNAAVFEITSKSLAVREDEEGLCCCTNHFRCPEMCVSKECGRYAILEKSGVKEKLSRKDVAQQMHAVSQGGATLQTMIFEPARLRLHLAYGQGPATPFGPGPATALPLHELNLQPLFQGQKSQK